MPITQACLDALQNRDHSADGLKGGILSGQMRFNSTLQIAELQHIMRDLAKDMSIDPAKRTAAANAYVKLEAQRRCNLGKANPAPVKSEPKRGKRSSGAMRPAFVEPQPEQAQAQPSTEQDKPAQS